MEQHLQTAPKAPIFYTFSAIFTPELVTLHETRPYNLELFLIHLDKRVAFFFANFLKK